MTLRKYTRRGDVANNEVAGPRNDKNSPESFNIRLPETENSAKIKKNSELFLDNNPNDSIRLKLLTVDEVAEILHVSIPTVRRLIDERQIRFLKIRGSVRVDEHDLADYLMQHRVESIGA